MAAQLPDSDYKNLADILNTIGPDKAGQRYLDLLMNYMEFAGSTPIEATFIDKDGFRIILMPEGRWRAEWPNGEKSEDADGYSLLAQIVDPRQRLI
jgi:hypothetical protein